MKNLAKLTSNLFHSGITARPPTPTASPTRHAHADGQVGHATINNPVDHAADKTALERKSKLARLRGMFHIHKNSAEDGIRHTARPLKGLNFLLFKELMHEIVHTARSDESWKVRADSAEKIYQKLEGAENHLNRLNDVEKNVLADEFEKLSQSIDEALSEASAASSSEDGNLSGSKTRNKQDKYVRRTEAAHNASAEKLKMLASTLRKAPLQPESNESDVRERMSTSDAATSKAERKQAPKTRQDAWLSACGLGSLAQFRKPRATPLSTPTLSDNVKVPERQQLESKLLEIQSHFSALRQHNSSPHNLELHFDKALLPIMAAAENARTSGLNLKSFASFGSFIDEIQSGTLREGRVLIPVPSHLVHMVAADIKTIDGQLSILMLEPSAVTNKDEKYRKLYEFGVAPVLNSYLPSNTKVAVLSLDTQKSSADCAIFGLSAVSKIADEEKLFQEIHTKNLAGELAALAPIKVASPSETRDEIVPADSAEPDFVLLKVGIVSVLDARQLLPVSFQKHTQSASAAHHWAMATNNSLHQPVNKPGDTLLSRMADHTVERYKVEDNAPGETGLKQKQVKFNASIEEKRLVYLQRAIEHLQSAPDSEVTEWLSHFKSIMENRKMPSEAGLSLDNRPIGPQRVPKN